MISVLHPLLYDFTKVKPMINYGQNNGYKKAPLHAPCLLEPEAAHLIDIRLKQLNIKTKPFSSPLYVYVVGIMGPYYFIALRSAPFLCVVLDKHLYINPGEPINAKHAIVRKGKSIYRSIPTHLLLPYTTGTINNS